MKIIKPLRLCSIMGPVIQSSRVTREKPTTYKRVVIETEQMNSCIQQYRKPRQDGQSLTAVNLVLMYDQTPTSVTCGTYEYDR